MTNKIDASPLAKKKGKIPDIKCTMSIHTMDLVRKKSIARGASGL